MARPGMVIYHGVESGDELAQYARAAEKAGLDSLWVTERYFHEETFSLLGYLAAVTEYIKLGLGVTNPYTRNPALLAMAAATMDRISGGRFVLGLGRSEKSVVQGRMGIEFGDSRAALREAVEIVTRLTSGKRVTTRGKRFELTGATLAVRPVAEKVPVYLGAIGPTALRLAGAIADGVLLNAYSPAGYVRYAVEQVREAARAAGRDPRSVTVACMMVVRVTESPDRIWRSLKARLVRLLAEPHVGEVLLEESGFDPSILRPLRVSVAKDQGEAAPDLITDEMVEAFYVVGTAERCMQRVAEYREAGVDLPLLLPRLRQFEEVAEMAGQLQ